MPPSPSMSAAPSAAEIMPVFASIAACAMLPRMSCLYILLSTAMDELKSSAALSSAACARPAQSFSMPLTPLCP